jgi:prolyl oligopeptidase
MAEAFQSQSTRRRFLARLGAASVAPTLGVTRAGFSLAQTVVIPPAPRDTTVDVLHGVSVPDPFRPFEDSSRLDCRAWIDAMDDAAKTVLSDSPLHDQVRAFVKSVGRYSRPFPPRRAGGKYFSMAFDGTNEQARLEVRERPLDAPRVLIDPTQFAADGTTSLWGYFPDRLANKVAYLTADAGGDATVLRIRDVPSGLDLNDRLEGCRFTSVAWLANGNSFYYSRPPLETEAADWDRKGHCIFHHRLGYPQATDRMVLRFPTRRNVHQWIRASYTTNQLLIAAHVGTDEKTGLWIAPLENASLAIRVIPMGRYSFWVIRNVGAALYAITDLDAPKRRIVRATLGAPTPNNWKTIVPEGEGVIDGARLVRDKLVVRRFIDLGHTLSVYDLEGTKHLDIPMAACTAISLGQVPRASSEMYISTSTRQQPGQVHKLDIASDALEVVAPALPPPHDLADIEVRADLATASDGTKIPMTLMHRKGLAMTGDNRTLLYAYGGFAISQWPVFGTLPAAWVRLGGVYAVAHIRGGGEAGQRWHEQARGKHRQVAFDDFHAAAQWLIESRITRADRLGIYGASNGGLLVLAAMLQKPQLYGAVVAGVPVADMLRFPVHTFGVSWKPEYGDPDRAEDFSWLKAYSPLHNVKPGVTYPPLLILTADNDQRVVPAHAYKFAATLREMSPASEVYVRTRRGAGHGGGNAYSKNLEFQADLVTFLTARLGGPVEELPNVGG